MRKIKGFTLLELIIVIVILGILTAIAVPKYLDLRANSVKAAIISTESAVRSAYAITIAEKKDFPTIGELVKTIGGVSGSAVFAEPTGVKVEIDGKYYIVRTFKDRDCGAASSAVTDIIQCVGSIDKDKGVLVDAANRKTYGADTYQAPQAPHS